MIFELFTCYLLRLIQPSATRFVLIGELIADPE